jgi:hypothetical protein
MAKRRRRSSKLGSAAGSLGHALGVLANKVERVNQQRAAVSKEIIAFVQHAQGMLSDLGHGARIAIPRARKRFTTALAAAQKPGRRTGFKVSAAARRKMSLAAKRRWAAIKKAAVTK